MPFLEILPHEADDNAGRPSLLVCPDLLSGDLTKTHVMSKGGAQTMRELVPSLPAAVCFTLAILLLPAGPALAGQPDVIPGKYVTQGGWGNLSIRKDKSGRLAFEISAVGANAHTCSLDGIIENNKAALEGLEGGKPCIVTFTPKGRDIDVSDNGEACRMYCGARADFTGLYVTPKPGCDQAAIRKSRDEFKRLYGGKSYARARDVLAPVLNNCGYVLFWADLDWIRNDLALTYYKLGNSAACLRTLQPVIDEARDVVYGPSEEETRRPIERATQTNLNLCRKGGSGKP